VILLGEEHPDTGNNELDFNGDLDNARDPEVLIFALANRNM